MAVRGERRELAAEEIDRLRAKLRMADADVRTKAVAELQSWQGARLGPGAGLCALRAATVGYPWVDAVPADPGELLVQLLWRDPGDVTVAELERAYVFCAERARRSILRTLALRRDVESLDAVLHLMGLDGPVDLLPVPTEDLLRPLLDVVGVERLVPVLVSAAWRRGWVPVVADMLGEMVQRGLLDGAATEDLCEGLSPLLLALVDTCDRAATMADSGALARVDRERLAVVVPLFGSLASDEAVVVLRRVLACVDPRVGASAAVALAGRGEVVGEDRIALIARDPEARRVLLAGLARLGRGFELPDELRSEVAIAEAEVVSYLAGRTQLGAPPDDLEHRGVFATPLEWGRGLTHLFAFRVRPPHWSASRGWMLVAAGPFDASMEFMPQRSEGFEVCSLYEPEDGDEISRHLLQISRAVVAARSQDEAA
ncbi:MAG: hypothetical protein ACR2OH_04385 [Microthrixaceae bacterium]